MYSCIHTHAHAAWLTDLPPFHTTDQYKLDKGPFSLHQHTFTQRHAVHAHTHKHNKLKMAEMLLME